MPNKILYLFAHPLFEKSRINKTFIKEIKNHHHIHFHDLYELYPDFNIDIEHEKGLLLKHNTIIWHHPFYWYSCPPLLKQWIDMVLEVGWAYGPGGTALQGKKVLQVISTGGPETAYHHEGYNHYTIREFLAPFERTVALCNMHYLPPFVTHGTHRLTDKELHQQTEQFKKIIDIIVDETFDLTSIQKYSYINEIVKNNE